MFTKKRSTVLVLSLLVICSSLYGATGVAFVHGKGAADLANLYLISD